MRVNLRDNKGKREREREKHTYGESKNLVSLFTMIVKCGIKLTW